MSRATSLSSETPVTDSVGDASRLREWLLVSGGEISSGLSATVGPYLINLGLIGTSVGESGGSALDDNGASDGGTD